jgi:hypothetical protein
MENNGTVVENNTTPEVVETAPEDENDYQLTLEELMVADFGEDPIMSQTHTGLKPYNQILESLPEDARKLVANLRAMATKKTQEVADGRRQLESERANLIKDREALLSGNFRSQIDQLATAPIQHDLWSEEGMQAKIQQEAAKMFQQMLNPLQQELEQSKRGAQLEAFKSANPDLLTHKTEIAKLLIEREDLKLEDAYYIVKGQKAGLQAAADREGAKSRVAAVSKTSTGQNINGTVVPKFKDSWEAYNYFKSNPEASAAVNRAGNKIRR